MPDSSFVKKLSNKVMAASGTSKCRVPLRPEEKSSVSSNKDINNKAGKNKFFTGYSLFTRF